MLVGGVAVLVRELEDDGTVVGTVVEGVEVRGEVCWLVETLSVDVGLAMEDGGTALLRSTTIVTEKQMFVGSTPVDCQLNLQIESAFEVHRLTTLTDQCFLGENIEIRILWPQTPSSRI